MKKLTLTLFIVMLCLSLLGEWSVNPSQNTVISDLDGSQVIPKIGICQNGDYYIAWFSNGTGNYDVRLQRMNSQGDFLWEANGILVSDHETMTWLTDWDMTVDNEDNAILTWQDISTGFNNIFVYKVATDGSLVWGDDGVQLSDTEAFDASPKVCVTSENNVIVAWQSEDVVKINKISANGELPWGSPGVEIAGENTFSWPQPLAVEDDNVIVKYFNDSGPLWAPDRYVYAQKYDADGNSVWDTPAIITDEGGITAWNQVFSMVKDDQNGFYIGWHEDRYNTMNAHVFAQYIGADGSILFADDGIELSFTENRQKYNPKIVWDQASEDIFVYWTEMDSDQNNAGIFGQRLNAVGELLWTNNAKEIVALQSPRFNLQSAETAPEGAFLFANIENTPNNIFKAALVDSEGDFVWENEFEDVSTVSSSKSHSVSCGFSNNQWVMAWEDDRMSLDDLYAQNISINGELGPVTLITGIAGTISLDSGDGNIEDVVVTSGTVTVNPDADGLYFFELDPGTYTITASLQNYQEVELTDIVVETGIINSDNDIVLIYSGTSADDLIPEPISLFDNYPNPFNPTTHIRFQISESAPVVLDIYNVRGEKVKTLVNETLAPQLYDYVWSGTDDDNNMIGSGIYFYKLRSGKYTSTKKMILMK